MENQKDPESKKTKISEADLILMALVAICFALLIIQWKLTGDLNSLIDLYRENCVISPKTFDPVVYPIYNVTKLAGG